MRPQSSVQVQVRDLIIGGPKPAVCLPLVGETRARVIEEAEALTALQPDLLEWRIDGYEGVEDIQDSLALLKDMRRIISNIPLIFTCRIDQEGGMRSLSSEHRLQLVGAAMATGDIDLLDIEICSGRVFIDAAKEKAVKHDVKLILSYHNFTETPSKSFIYAKLTAARGAGADIAKVAVMPKNHNDVLTLLRASWAARKETVDCPIVTMSMGEEGVVSRLAGGLYGSDITFAVGMGISAPGQIPIAELRQGMAVLYRD